MPCILFRLWNTRAKVHAAVGLGETAPCLPLIFQRPRLFPPDSGCTSIRRNPNNRSNFASLFRETELRTHEYQFKCGYVVRQMLPFVICHIVLYKIV